MFNFHHIYNIVHIAVKLKIAARQLETVLCCFTVTRMTIQLMIIFPLMEWMCRSSEFSCLSLVGRVQIYHLRLSKKIYFCWTHVWKNVFRVATRDDSST